MPTFYSDYEYGLHFFVVFAYKTRVFTFLLVDKCGLNGLDHEKSEMLQIIFGQWIHEKCIMADQNVKSWHNKVLKSFQYVNS